MTVCLYSGFSCGSLPLSGEKEVIAYSVFGFVDTYIIGFAHGCVNDFTAFNSKM